MDHDDELNPADQSLLAQTSPWPNLLDYYSRPPKAGQSSRQTKRTSPGPSISAPSPSRSTVDVAKLKGRLQLSVELPSNLSRWR
jgi:hypothetical protein